MSSPSRTNDLHEAHWPSLQPCMSMNPARPRPQDGLSLVDLDLDFADGFEAHSVVFPGGRPPRRPPWRKFECFSVTATPCKPPGRPAHLDCAGPVSR